MASSSCSTTMTVLSLSRNIFSVSNNLSLSLWCRPMDGSSNTYSTPDSPLPICDAKRIRCASPPDSVPDIRDNVKYPSPTFCKNCRRLVISRKTMRAISLSFCDKWLGKSVNHANDSSTAILHVSIMSRPLILIHSAWIFSRFPWHIGHGFWDWYFANSVRMDSDSDSRQRRSRFGMTPSYGFS